jgi:hypothetical protein
MRAIAPLAALVAALAVSGCGGSTTASPTPSETTQTTTTPQPVAQPAPKPPKPSRVYTKRELPLLVLRPKDGPKDMRFLASESGPRTLEEMGLILPRQVDEMRNYGFLTARDAIFVARSPRSDRRVAQRVWLMRTPKLASKWLARTKDDLGGLGFEQVTPEKLGEESWAATGQAAGGAVITHSFRLGNAVFVVTSFASSEDLTPAAARAAAHAALARARKV